MQKLASFKVTGLTPPKVDKAMSKIVHASTKYHVSVLSPPKTEKVTWSKTRARFSGCEEIELKRKVIRVKGETANLRKLLRTPINDVYIELLL